MKMKIYRFLLFLILLPAVLYIILLVIKRIPANNRRYEATLNRVGWHINMEEQNSYHKGSDLLLIIQKPTRNSMTINDIVLLCW